MYLNVFTYGINSTCLNVYLTNQIASPNLDFTFLHAYPVARVNNQSMQLPFPSFAASLSSFKLGLKIFHSRM